MSAPDELRGFAPSRAPARMLDWSSRRGRVLVTYRRVITELGAPLRRPLDPTKTRCMWRVHTPHGPVAIYDYYFDVDPSKVPDALCVWHIGAHNDLAARWIAAHLTTQLTDSLGRDR